jgi:hypothetical protein
VGEDGTFSDARFELEDRAVRTLFDEPNPFIGTKQLDGLKIVVMLLSNWDSKDRRDVSRGSNTAIFEHRISRSRTRRATSSLIGGRHGGATADEAIRFACARS